MKKFILLAIFWLTCTLLSYWATSLIVANHLAELEGKDQSFVYPISHDNKVHQWILRNDSMGLGHFWASRSRGRKHKGIDLAANIDENVVSAYRGRVLTAANSGAYGKLIRLMHSNGMETRYAHLNEISVRKGNWVRAGERIGSIGKTGNANHEAIQPHLHFEIRRDGKALNPMHIYNQDIQKN